MGGQVDADMILRKPFTVREIPAKIGVVAAGYYGYLSGVKNDMAAMFVGPAVKRAIGASRRNISRAIS